jgi:hypothetical protein
VKNWVFHVETWRHIVSRSEKGGGLNGRAGFRGLKKNGEGPTDGSADAAPFALEERS